MNLSGMIVDMPARRVTLWRPGHECEHRHKCEALRLVFTARGIDVYLRQHDSSGNLNDVSLARIELEEAGE